MKLRNILALILALCVVFTLCACGESGSGNDEETEAQTEEQNDTGSNGEEKKEVAEYVVNVVDEDGDPIEGVSVQFSKDSGDTTGTTNEDGTMSLTCLITDIVVTVEDVPSGYEADSDEYTFEEGSFEMTITLKDA